MKTVVLIFLAVIAGGLGGMQLIVWHMAQCCQCRRRMLHHWEHAHGNGFICSEPPLHLHHHQPNAK